MKLINFDCKKINLIRKNNLNFFPKISLFKQVIRVLFFKIDFKFIDNNSTTLMVKSWTRDDIDKEYNFLIYKINKKFKKKPSELKIFDKYKFNLNLKNFKIISFKKIFKIIFYEKNPIKELLDYFTILESTNFIYRLIHSNKNFYKIKCSITTMEMQYYENILTQYFNIKKKNTFTLNHAFYRFEGYTIKPNNVGPINYMAAVSKYSLVWGNAQKKFVKKYTKQIPIIIGSSIKKINKVKKNKLRFDNNKLILLESEKKLHKNYIMINQLRSCNKILIIKHPDDQNYYKNTIDTTHTSQNLPSKVFGCDTSALIRYGISNFNIYLYKDSFFLKNNIQYFKKSEYSNFYILKKKFKLNFWTMYTTYSKNLPKKFINLIK